MQNPTNNGKRKWFSETGSEICGSSLLGTRYLWVCEINSS
jgi:hypothetical protein